MSRGGESAGKRRVSAQQRDRREAKNERRRQRQEALPGEPEDREEVMSRFHTLNELRHSGTITEEDFERQRREIFVHLGLEQL